jgi:eukaryotic-like serine/threonine-protein kinase
MPRLALASGTRLGPYEILAPAGSGGMGEVYRARDTRLDRLVAVKVLPTDTLPSNALERFEREAKAIAALNHPGICAIYDIGTTPVPYLVMELLEGETLQQRIQRGPLDIPLLVDIGVALADALASAHARGIIHRDLKPANLLLTPHGPKIVDFGLARVTQSSAPDVEATASPTMSARAPLTDPGVAVGTVAYMSPEQLRGETLDARSDLFSLGCVLYEMATGRRAFAGATNAVRSAAILHAPPVAPRQLRLDLPARLEQTILKLLQKDCDVRTQTASELRADLTRLKRELSLPPAPGTIITALDSDTEIGTHRASAPGVAVPATSSDAQVIVGVLRRHRQAVTITAAVLLAAVVGLVYFVKSGTTAAPPIAGASSLSIASLQVEQLTTSGTAHAPAISPDGNYVVYIERGFGRDSLRVRQVASGSNVEIVPPEAGTDLRGATVTPDGAFVNYVKQVRGQAAFELWQVPFLGGSARRLLQAGSVGFSPSGDRMAYVREAGADRAELVVASSDGNSERVVASRQSPKRFWGAVPSASVAPAWSPDGRTIAVLGGKDGESATGQIVLVDVTSGLERTADAGPTRFASGVGWLGNGTLLASMLDRPSAPQQLWLVSVADGTFRRLTNDTSQYIGVSLTADRNAVVTARAEFSFDIWTSDATAAKWSRTVPTRRSKGPVGNVVRWVGDDLLYVSSSSRGFALSRWRVSTQSEEILAQGGGNPSVARDGSTIFFLDYDSRDFWKMDLTRQNRVRIQRAVLSPEAGHVTADGRHYVTIDRRAGGATAAIMLAALDGNDSREITADRIRPGVSVLDGGRVEVSPDGQWIAYPSVGEGNQPVIAVCDVAACSSRRTLPARARWRWMPDSKALAYVDPKTVSDLWVEPLDGSAPRQLTHFAPDGQQIWDFDWSADGRRLAVARGTTSTDIVLFRGLQKK